MNKTASLIGSLVFILFSFNMHASAIFDSNPIEKWSLYTDSETSTCFVDFESIAVKLNEVVVENSEGEIVFREDVSDIPVDAIYEIDFSRFEKGAYSINLHYYTGVLSKIIKIEK